MREWKKYEKDGQVAVLVSPGFGAGWSTWAYSHQAEQAMFDSRLVDAALVGADLTEELLKECFGEEGEHFYTGGWSRVEVRWVPKGTRIRINEYDGAETLEILGPDSFYTA